MFNDFAGCPDYFFFRFRFFVLALVAHKHQHDLIAGTDFSWNKSRSTFFTKFHIFCTSFSQSLLEKLSVNISSNSKNQEERGNNVLPPEVLLTVASPLVFGLVFSPLFVITHKGCLKNKKTCDCTITTTNMLHWKYSIELLGCGSHINL
jgi:hypothetical protein